jgi:hypothetical protein
MYTVSVNRVNFYGFEIFEKMILDLHQQTETDDHVERQEWTAFCVRLRRLLGCLSAYVTRLMRFL